MFSRVRPFHPFSSWVYPFINTVCAIFQHTINWSVAEIPPFSLLQVICEYVHAYNFFSLVVPEQNDFNLVVLIVCAKFKVIVFADERL